MCILNFIINHFCIVIWILWIFLSKNSEYFFGMLVLFRENNCFSKLLPIINLDAIRHQNMQYLFYGIFIKNPGI